jgi:hypothetical protein
MHRLMFLAIPSLSEAGELPDNMLFLSGFFLLRDEEEHLALWIEGWSLYHAVRLD